MNPYYLQETNWKETKDRKYDTAVLPWGCTEAHNLHLPYGTDTFLASEVALKSAGLAWEKGARCIVLPTIPFGGNSGQMDVKLCMNLHPSTQKIILHDVIQVLIKDGIHKLVILNAHGGNNFQPAIRELSVEFPGMIMCSINWWQVCDGDRYFCQQGDHAGELETSAMMALHPELVLPLSEAGDGAENKMKIRGFKEKWAWTPRRWIYTTRDTGVGDPKEASAEKGERFMKDCIEKIADFLTDFSKIENEKELYG